MTSAHIPGQVFGNAGRSLAGAGNTWAKNVDVAKIGQTAETRSERIINRITATGPTVLHDLTIPGSSANIDHVVVFGYHVLILDTKQWARGTYWTFRGKTRNGFGLNLPGAGPTPGTIIGTHAPHCDKRTLALATERLEQHFKAHGVHAKVHTPALVIWSSGEANFLGYRPAGGSKVVQGNRLESWLKHHTSPMNAHPAVITALLPLSN